MSAPTDRDDRPFATPVVDDTVAARLAPGSVALRLLEPDGTGRGPHLVVHAYSAGPSPLVRVLGVLGALDLSVVDQHQSLFARADGLACRLDEFVVARAGTPEGADGAATPIDAAAVTDAMDAMIRGVAETDRLATLVGVADLDWREVALLRAYTRYLRQTRLPFDSDRLVAILSAHPRYSALLVALVRARLDPRRAADPGDTTAAAIRAQLVDLLEAVPGRDEDRALRAYLALVEATVRTTFFRPDTFTAARPQIALKFAAHGIAELPAPRPVHEFFVYSPTTEGVHLRYGSVARGGVRWSERLDDYRTEILGLAKAQCVKNSVIVPAGAKGGFVVRDRVPGRDRIEAGRRSYREFVTGMLDLTDDLADDGTVVRPPHVVCLDDPDTYLVVAPDKGTAAFSDLANEVATSRGYWLGDAFASGGSVGYDHKRMGITARGAWISVERHLVEVGVDPTRESFTVVGIGDMSGDVFGNAMLTSANIALVAAFDHRHVFVDPTPDPAVGHAERRRLAALPGSTWDDYDRAALSAGGGVWSREVKGIPVAASVAAALGLAPTVTSLSPSDLVSAILRAPVDVLFNGGIGTYVKASDEPHSAASDKANDGVRVDADTLRAAVVGEGGNLGFTPRARVEFARAGGRILTDAVDNAAGVDCSDHEVNIKILLRGARVDDERRSALLAESTDDVARSVLAHNREQTRILSQERATAAWMLPVHARMIRRLERTRGLDRVLDALPADAALDARAAAGDGLTTPELATVLAHAKLDLEDALLEDPVFDDPFFTPRLHRYFPRSVRGEAADRHPLRRAILATETVNDLFAVGGLTFSFRVQEETGASPVDVVRAFVVACGVLGIDDLVQRIVAEHHPPAIENALIREARRVLDRAARWFLARRPQPLAPAAEIARFAEVHGRRALPAARLVGPEQQWCASERRRFEDDGAAPETAANLADGLYRFCLLDIVEIAERTATPLDEATALYFALSAHLEVDRWLIAVSRLPRADRASSLARSGLREDLYGALRTVTADVLAAHRDAHGVDERIALWERRRRDVLARCRRGIDELADDGDPGLAALSVVVGRIRAVAEAS